MASLYELTGDYIALMDAIDGAEDETQLGELMQQFDAVQGSITEKADAYARIIKNKTSEADAYKAEADRLTARRRAAENVVAGLKQRLQECMQSVGAERLTTSIGEWRLQKNQPSVTITDEAEIPADYRIPQPDKIDKTGILRWYKETGEILPGVDIDRSMSLRFK